MSEGYGYRNAQLEQTVQRGAAALAQARADGRAREMKAVEKEAYNAARGAAKGGGGGDDGDGGLELVVAGGMLTIGDVSAPVRHGSAA
eukprot:5880831-Prymnesium_polylepis.1